MAHATMTVSLLTVSRGNRVPFLHLQWRNIQASTIGSTTGSTTVHTAVEWVVVDGSRSADERAVLEAFLLRELVTPPGGVRIRYVRPPTFEAPPSALYNIVTAAAQGDVLVWMDDDNYYMPEYVEYAVSTLVASGVEAAGCDGTLMYDLRWRMLHRGVPRPDNFFTCRPSCLAYTKEFGRAHAFVDTLEGISLSRAPDSEEGTGGAGGVLSMRFVHLDPHKCMVHMVHGSNTTTCEETLAMHSPLYSDVCSAWVSASTIPVTECSLSDLLPSGTLAEYERVAGAVRGEPSEYDIVFFCGTCYSLCCMMWDPEDTALGGSEQAIVHLTKSWARAGKRVAVYGDFAFAHKVVDGVDYYAAGAFEPQRRFRALVLWRSPAIASANLLPWTMSADKILLDVHDACGIDTVGGLDLLLNKYPHMRVMFKSCDHAKTFLNHSQDAARARAACRVVPNGVQIHVFGGSNERDEGRDPFRFCYASSYDRGLCEILEHVWPRIVAQEPRAELHVYYGQTTVEIREKMRTLLPVVRNVCDHGRQPIDLVAREKRRSTFHLYVSNTNAETDCISVKESLAAGCIPLMLDRGVFAERDGVHFDPEASWESIADEIAELMCNQGRTQALRERLRRSPTIVPWDVVASKWLDDVIDNDPHEGRRAGGRGHEDEDGAIPTRNNHFGT
jgi:glycosyltransferase involved in cell wall biosynthesis